MEDNSFLARFGIGKKFDYKMFIQSILVIISTIFALIAIYSVFTTGGIAIECLSTILIFLTCICLIICSFGSNKNKQSLLTIGLVIFIINNIAWIIVQFLALGMVFPYSLTLILMIIEVLLYCYFIYALYKNSSNAKYAILLAAIIGIIEQIISCLYGWSVYSVIFCIFVTVSIVLTYLVRVPEKIE